MEEKMSFLSQFRNSIVSFESYRHFLRQKVGRAVLYLLLLSLILSAVTGIKVLYDFNYGIDVMIRNFRTEVPNFVLKNGELTVDAPMPYYVEKDEDFLFVIDTSGKLDESVLNDYPEGIFLSRYEAVLKQNAFEIRKIDFSSLAGATITKDEVINWLPLLKWLSIFIIVFGFLFYFIGKLLSALLISLLGLIMSSAAKFRMEFGDLYKLSIYTLTLPMVIKALVGLAGINIPFFWLIYYGIAVFYLWKAIQLLKRDTELKPEEKI